MTLCINCFYELQIKTLNKKWLKLLKVINKFNIFLIIIKTFAIVTPTQPLVVFWINVDYQIFFKIINSNLGKNWMRKKLSLYYFKVYTKILVDIMTYESEDIGRLGLGI